MHSYKHTWERRCFPPHRSPASAHLSQAWSWGCQQYIQYPAGWPLARQRRWSGGEEQRKEHQSKVWVDRSWWNHDAKQSFKQYLRHRAKSTFLYVVSPEASTLLWPIFFSWAWPTPNGDGICHKERKGIYKCIRDLCTPNTVYIDPSEVIWNWTMQQTNADERCEREDESNRDRWHRRMYNVKEPLTSVIWAFLAESVDKDRERRCMRKGLRGVRIGTLFSKECQPTHLAKLAHLRPRASRQT